ncbi:MAG: hypothetical protein N2504_05960 [candidate division WOR-3 bacterium]|nr:hypothetical protein [candidate division WOR-3 bacterium]MCX7948115.1 hypothetical protein [candidate division WOR-3 bacterium]MDW8150807.1 hypothetical protein [candidate division WOR-3 bacterium]
MRKFLVFLLILGCRKSGDSQYNYSLYGIFANDMIFVALYDVKNSQVISDANIYLNERKLNYFHPFYSANYSYIENSDYTLKIYYREISEEIRFKTIKLPDTFHIVYPETNYIPLFQDLVIKWKVDSNYIKNYNYYFVVFFENKSKNPTLVYQTDFLTKETDSIVIPGYYIDTRDTRYEIRVFLVNYSVLDKFKPYPGYRFSFISYGMLYLGVYFTKP